MKIKSIPIDQIIVPSVRVSAQYDDETTRLLRDSIAALGLVTPIIVVQTEAGYEVVDGLHRWQEAKLRGDATISAVVHEGGPRESLLMNLVLNKVRGKVKASEMVAVIAELWKSHQMDSDAIAAKTGLTRDYIERLQRISTAAPSVQEALDAEVIGVGHAYELSRLPTAAQQDEVMARLQVWRYPVKELKALVDSTLALMQQAATPAAPGAPPAPPAPAVYHCEGCKREADLKYLRMVTLCPDCFGHVFRLSKTTGATTPSAPHGAQGA